MNFWKTLRYVGTALFAALLLSVWALSDAPSHFRATDTLPPTAPIIIR
jgi:hypothetical protein